MASPVRRLLGAIAAFGFSVVLAASGCRPQQPFYFFEDGDLSHYIDRATEIEYPDAEVPSLEDATQAHAPLTVANANPEEYWDLSLQEAVRIGLANGKVFRVLNQPDSLLTNPDFASSVYDPALAEANPRFGPEAALAAFDAQFTTSVFWEKNDTPQNSASIAGFNISPTTLQQDLGSFQAQLRKTMATGGTWSLTHNVLYDQNNRPFRQHISDWSTNVEAEFRQPLLQGNGVQFNRIAGPGAIPGFYNGVIIARINTDISLADFEAQVRNLVLDIERAYWELYFAYRSLHALNAALIEAADTWQKVRAEYEAEKVAVMDEGVARHQYYFFRNLVEQAQSNLFRQEAALRQLMGIATSDGRLIRPSDEPTTAKVTFDWQEAHAEALSRAVELRRQRWRVKQREMELIAAKNFLLPRLDAVGRYRWLGLGDELIDSVGGDPVPTNFGSDAYSAMMSGNWQEWHLGLELTFPLGFRKEMAAVRHAQLQLARERVLLQEQELDVVRLLADEFRNLDEAYLRAQTNFNRFLSAMAELQGYKEKERAGLPVRQASLNFILDSQRRVAEAAIDFFRALVDYNIAVAAVHYRKSSLLEYNGVYLAEGPWPAKAYFDAHRRARARDASFYLDYGFTRPKVISRGLYNQQAGSSGMFPQILGTDASVGGESGEVQLPQPEPIPTPVPMPLEGLGEPQASAAGPATGAVANGRNEAIPSTRGFTSGISPTMVSASATGGSRRNRGFDLADLDLAPLSGGGNTDGKAASKSAPVQLTAFTDSAAPNSVPAGGSPPVQGWESSKGGSAGDATIADLSPVETNRSASGWKRLSR